MAITEAGTYHIDIRPVQESRLQGIDFDSVPFGRVFSDHMFLAEYKNGQWQQCRIQPFGPLPMHPGTAVLHYGQGIFEGMKAFKDEQGNAQLFRPLKNWERMNMSARRMALPEIPEELFMEALTTLVRMDSAWIPPGEDGSLYIRPFLFASDALVGIKPAEEFLFMIICCPVAKYYNKPVRVYMSDHYVRAFRGGTGHAKAIGNYGAVMQPLAEVREMGFDQILWLDGYEFNRLQEIGTMNVFVVIDDVVLTPSTEEKTILEGITRESCIILLREKGYQVEERDITVPELLNAAREGRLTDAFGTGTAATVAPIGEIGYKDEVFTLPPVDERPVSIWLANEMRNLRKGHIPDTHNWLFRL
ncbi:MAG: branched-chain amino acid aminotransferase [Chitinophagales bacterium]|nr:branched-chain amino acid aminotransferase [Chitinophagales bacterium]MCB9021659.1 branched-chain amino acid aminotransferase [Chitinophagales bacterium]MCB9031088.1 branched-chain amino acid aminotransferase [Chitinophagales bacterium]HPE98446.1 branched-chain amino acid aminotransferase [Chitinophagales bacterium]HQU40601.1 branched-chain amino acid aminotransferase [Chitinophagales bacterium]